MSRDLRILYAYRIVSRLYFHLPVLFVFFVLQGFSVFEAELLLGAFGLAVTLSFPLGARLRRGLRLKWIVALGELAKLAGLGLVVVSGDPWLAAVGQAVNGVGFGLTQGTDPALLGKVAPDPEANARAQANTQSWMFLAVLVAGVAGAFAFDADREAVFLASMGSALVAAVLVVLVREDAPAPTSAAAAAAAPALTPSAQEEWWMRYYVLLRAVTLAVFVGFLPYLFFERLELSLQWFGTVLGVFSVAAFVGARYAVLAMRTLGEGRMMQVTVALNVGALVLLATEPPIGVALVGMLLLGLSAGGVRPLTMSGLGERRGQLAGVMERRFGLLNAGVLVAGGALLDLTDFRTLLVALTVVYVVALLLALGRGGRLRLGGAGPEVVS